MRPEERAAQLRRIRDKVYGPDNPGGDADLVTLAAAELERLGVVERNMINLIYQPQDRCLGDAMVVVLGGDPANALGR